MKCTATVMENKYDWHSCRNKAKWKVRTMRLCGVHARLGNMWVKAYGRVPIKPIKRKVASGN